MSKYILSLDQGTTSSRAILFDHAGQVQSVSQREFKQHFPKPGWVEHDAEEIWAVQLAVAKEALHQAGATSEEVAAIGITNQRETTLIWDRATGKPIHHAIVWQDRRTAAYCDQLKHSKWAKYIKDKTGLITDAYFSATKIKWLLDHVPQAKERAKRGELAFGTMDAWLVWSLTEGQVHATDVSNASRTMLFDIHALDWDDKILALMDIPRAILPEVRSCSEVYGHTHLLGSTIPIGGFAGDQQSALFGQMCVEPGMVKNTYGTGCFILTNTGTTPVSSQNNLLTSIGWQIGDQVTYILEGSVFVTGAVVQWIRDGLEFVADASEIEALANSVPDNGGVYLVPAFVGLGAPHWDQYARGAIFGMTRGTNRGHIARAALEAICFQSQEVISAMAQDAKIEINELRVDGGATVNDTLMQTQSDVMGLKVIRPLIKETTALGAAYLAGLAVGFWKSIDEIKSQWAVAKTFEPKRDMSEPIKYWKKAVARSKDWAEE